MAKRFTDTDKWNDEWFMELDPVLKCFWIYLCDKCDHAGVWKVNFKQASFSIGAIIDKQSALNAFGERVWVLSVEKWFIQKFILFQYPTGLSETNKAHIGVFKSLSSNKIDSSPFLAPLKLLDSPFLAPHRGAKEKEQEKDMELDKDLEKEQEKNLSKNESLNFRNSKLTPDDLIQLFNDTVVGTGKVVHCRGLSGKNIQEFITTTSFAEFQKIETWKEVFQTAKESPFLTGQQPGSTFVMTLNWLISHDKALSVLNGQYGKGESENDVKSLFAGISEGA